MATNPRAKISYRISPLYYTNPQRRVELLEFLAEYRDTIDEVAFFTAFTHPPRPLAFMQERALLLKACDSPLQSAGAEYGD